MHGTRSREAPGLISCHIRDRICGGCQWPTISEGGRGALVLGCEGARGSSPGFFSKDSSMALTKEKSFPSRSVVFICLENPVLDH